MIDHLATIAAQGAEVSLFSTKISFEGNDHIWTCKIELKREAADIAVRTFGSDVDKVISDAISYFDKHFLA